MLVKDISFLVHELKPVQWVDGWLLWLTYNGTWETILIRPLIIYLFTHTWSSPLYVCMKNISKNKDGIHNRNLEYIYNVRGSDYAPGLHFLVVCCGQALICFIHIFQGWFKGTRTIIWLCLMLVKQPWKSWLNNSCWSQGTNKFKLIEAEWRIYASVI